MSVYSVTGRGWRYDFTLEGVRYTEAWFKTKKAAKQAEAKRREEIETQLPEKKEILIDMDFLTLANKRLDYVKIYNSKSHYHDVRYHVQRWVKAWKGFNCSQISSEAIENYIRKRLEVSAVVANKELQYLRALFNFGIKKKYLIANPATGLEFFPVERVVKYIPPKTDLLKVILAADPDTQDYLWTMVLTAGRVGEINSMLWDDVNFEQKFVILWTRKRKGGNREPRNIPMVAKLYNILWRRFEKREPETPWVFWHTYWSRKENSLKKGPYLDRKKIMASLCKKVKVRYFRFHALRHLTASLLDDQGVPIGVIQRILGHKNRRTTEIYLHSIGEAERKAMQRLGTLEIFSEKADGNFDYPINMHEGYWRRKAKRPPYETLKREIAKLGYSGTGRKYGVSDNAVRKWIRFYEKQTESVSLTGENAL